jgi:hypothetical protein
MDVREKAIKHFESLQKRYTKQHNGKMCGYVKEALDAMTAHGVTVQEWISVKDERKPKNGGDTLVVVFNGYETYIDIDFFVGDRKWYLESKKRKVTHWQPMPQPPKEENDG